jgi:hypothetical protein
MDCIAMKLTFIQPALRATLVALVLSASITVCAAPHSIPPGQWEDTYNQGVEHYQGGEFSKALVSFQQVVQNVPESAEAEYYYAITLAQLGRFKDARKAYQTVMTLAPDSDSAKLAEEGLRYLPDPGKLDAPPQIKRASGSAPVSASQVVQAETANMFPNNVPATTGPAMDPQMMQMMMMMGAMGGGKGGGFNPMMIPMIQNMTQQPGADGQSADPNNKIPPSVFSTMIMNQMLQDFSPMGDKDD